MAIDCPAGDCHSPTNRSSSIPATSSMSVTALLNAVSESYPYDRTLLVIPASCSWYSCNISQSRRKKKIRCGRPHGPHLLLQTHDQTRETRQAHNQGPFVVDFSSSSRAMLLMK